MQFSPEVERWRSLVAKYFPPELVDKALWTIQHESGGNPGAVGDGGAARGLFQIQDKRNFSNRPDAAYLDNPENNIKYAAQELGAASGNFGAWGEGTTYNGQPFGAFGNNQYPGGAPMSSQGGGGVDPSYYTKYARWKALGAKFGPYADIGLTVYPDPATGQMMALIPTGKFDETTGDILTEPVPIGTIAEYNEFQAIDAELAAAEEEYNKQGGDVDDLIRRAQFQWETDPRNIDAENAADAYARELEARQQAVSLANTRLTQQNDSQQKAVDSFNAAAQGGGLSMSPQLSLESADSIFSKAVADVKKGLPEVPGRPYFDNRELPPDTSARPSFTSTLEKGDPRMGQLPAVSDLPPVPAADVRPTIQQGLVPAGPSAADLLVQPGGYIPPYKQPLPDLKPPPEKKDEPKSIFGISLPSLKPKVSITGSILGMGRFR